MRKTLILLVVLLSAFFIAWGIKVRVPVNRPNNIEEETEVAWYENTYSSPIADDEWVLDPSIPDNYVPVPGEDNLFMVVDTAGNITNYRQRTMNDEGTWIWEDINPDIPSNYELVNGSDNLYKLVNSDGDVLYFLYVRNEDDSYCFVACDEFGTPYYDGEDAAVIASNYIHEDDNIYSVYNEQGVKEGYAERVKNDKGNYVWKTSSAPSTPEITIPEVTTQVNEVSTNQPVSIKPDKEESTTEKQNNDGSYVVTNKSTNTVTENGYNVMYETIVYNTYDRDGNLIYTKTEGPYEVSREKASATEKPNKDLIKDKLDDEYNRVLGQVTYNTDKAKDVLANLNAERANQGLASLSMDVNSESYKLACIRAADMAIYNYSSSESPLYGTLDDMVARWNCTTASASENVWKTGNKTAEDIHSRLQAYDGSRNVRMSEYYTEIGIAIVEKEGQTYIAEVYLK